MVEILLCKKNCILLMTGRDNIRIVEILYCKDLQQHGEEILFNQLEDTSPSEKKKRNCTKARKDCIPGRHSKCFLGSSSLSVQLPFQNEAT